MLRGKNASSDSFTGMAMKTYNITCQQEEWNRRYFTLRVALPDDVDAEEFLLEKEGAEAFEDMLMEADRDAWTRQNGERRYRMGDN